MNSNKRRLAIVGTGHRGAGTWGTDAPAAATDQQRRIWILQEQQPVAVSVRTGISDRLRVQILEGLEEGDRLLISPLLSAGG